MTSAPAIGFDYTPSHWLRRLLLLVAALAFFAVMLCRLTWGYQSLLIIAIVLFSWQAWQRLTASPVVAAGWSQDADWTLRMFDEEDAPASLLSFRVLGAFVLLRLRTSDHGMQVLLLAPDNSDADIRRRLRMRLASIQPNEALPRL